MATLYLRTLLLFGRDVRLFLFTWGLTGFASFGIYGVLLNLYLLRLGYGPEFIGLVNSVNLLVSALFCLPAGALGGRWGSRRMLIASLFLNVVGGVLLPLVEFIPITWQVGWLVATRLLSGLSSALYLVNFSPFLMGITGPDERNHVYSVQFALSSLAGFAGNLVGGFLPGLFATALRTSLDSPASYRYPLFIASLLSFPAVLAMAVAREVRAGRAKMPGAEREAFPFGPIALMSAVVLLQGTGEGATLTFFNVYLDDGLGISAALIGALSAAGRALAVPAALAAPLLVARLGNGRVFALGLLGMAVSLLPLALIPHWGAAGVGLTVMTSMILMRAPSFLIYSMEMVSPDWRGAMSGATFMAQGFGFSAIAWGGGYTITYLGYPILFLAASGLTIAGAFLFWAYFLRTPRGELARRSDLKAAK